MLKLYGLTKSRALRCIWMLYELDVPFELVRISPKSPEFAVDVNPNRKIPALVRLGRVDVDSDPGAR